MQLLQLPEGLSRENPWNLPLNAMQRELICRYGLWKRIRFFDKKVRNNKGKKKKPS